ncbi:MAG: hypothetical protein AAGB13_01015 [Cyanobacteria bacterium P01_F01_bin.33]
MDLHSNYLDRFQTHLSLTISAMAAREKTLVLSCHQMLAEQFGSAAAEDIRKAALFHLADSDPDLCLWAMQHCLEPEECLDLIEDVVREAVCLLVALGYQPGRDFSSLATGEIWLREDVKAQLMEHDSLPGRLFINEIFQVPA